MEVVTGEGKEENGSGLGIDDGNHTQSGVVEMTVTEGNSELAQHEGHESDGENSEGTSSTVEIRDDDLVVQILARLDGESFEQAVQQDARSIAENFLIPPHFPWHSMGLPKRMIRTMPRDIDDLHVITHCQEELYAPFGDFQGAFGFGRYENGHARGNYSNTKADTFSLIPGNNDASAAARRSHDPGVLELNVQIPLPPSVGTVMNTKENDALASAEKWKDELSKDPATANVLSRLPYHWGQRDKRSPHVGDQQLVQRANGKLDVDVKLPEGILKREATSDERSPRAQQLELANSLVRKWKISMKVSGVSSRSTLFPRPTDVANDKHGIPEKTKRVIRPMLAMASMPQSSVAGKTVPMDKASEMDKAGFALSLGSYDCRYTDALSNPKKDSSRSKKVQLGRTRLVWSNLIQGDEPFIPSTRNKVNYNSLITGQRFDSSKCKRPTAVKVGVRLDGRIITEAALEELTTTASHVRKRKHSTRQAENEGQSKYIIHCPDSRTDEEIEAALQNHLAGVPSGGGQVTRRVTTNGSVVYVESSTHTEVDRNDIILSLLEANKRKGPKKLKRSMTGDNVSTGAGLNAVGGLQMIKRSNPPRFACVPLEDGLLRVVVLSAGNMSGAAVHQVLREASKQDATKRCSVCWSDEGSGVEGVQECMKCGLLVHPNCCHNKGQFITVSGNGDATDAQIEGGKWQCAVCCNFTETKPRRNQRMPSRFVDGETDASSDNFGCNDFANGSVNVPGPRCILCPHRGGAMSELESSGGASEQSPKWAHEVCRIWSDFSMPDNSKTKDWLPVFQQFPNVSPICALCGTGTVKSKKSMQFNAGLTKCAARGCHVVFHPMCALLASKVDKDGKADKAKAVRRKTRVTEEKKTDVDDEKIEADKKLCKEYTMQLIQLTRNEPANSSSDQGNKMTVIIPVAFCGIHNPQRDDSLYGCLPGGHT